MQRPVAKRSTRAGVRLPTHRARAPFSAAPTTALHSMMMRGDTMSGRLASAEAKVPTMNPACTAMVRPARPPSPSCHSRESEGSTAAALNQSDSALSLVEVLVVEIGTGERGAQAAAGDRADRGARADDAAGRARGRPEPRPRRAADEESRDGALGQRLVGIVTRLLLCLQIAIELIVVHLLIGLPLGGSHDVAGHVLVASRGQEHDGESRRKSASPKGHIAAEDIILPTVDYRRGIA